MKQPDTPVFIISFRGDTSIGEWRTNDEWPKTKKRRKVKKKENSPQRGYENTTRSSRWAGQEPSRSMRLLSFILGTFYPTNAHQRWSWSAWRVGSFILHQDNDKIKPDVSSHYGPRDIDQLQPIMLHSNRSFAITCCMLHHGDDTIIYPSVQGRDRTKTWISVSDRKNQWNDIISSPYYGSIGGRPYQPCWWTDKRSDVTNSLSQCQGR